MEFLPVQLIDYVVHGMQFEVNPQALDIEDEMPAMTPDFFKAEVVIGNKGDAMFSLKLEVMSQEPSEGILPYDFNITLIGRFAVMPDAWAEAKKNAEARRMMYTNATAILLGLARGIIHHSTKLGVFEPVILPSVLLNPPNDPDDEADPEKAKVTKRPAKRVIVKKS